MDDFCKKCGRCCRYIPVDMEKKTIYRDGIKPLDEEFSLLLSPADISGIDKRYQAEIMACFPDSEFYTCTYLSEDNLCTNPKKPEICEIYPSAPFAFIPEDCGYEGEVFLKNENFKQKIRRLKEEIVNYEAIISVSTEKQERDSFEKIIKFHRKFINKYSAYGSQDW